MCIPSLDIVLKARIMSFMTFPQDLKVVETASLLVLLATASCAGGQTFDDGADELSKRREDRALGSDAGTRAVELGPSVRDESSDGAAPPPRPSDASSPPLVPFVPAESWSGYLRPNDGSKKIRIEFSRGRESARLLFGTSNPPPKATEPLLQYPPGDPLPLEPFYVYGHYEGYDYVAQDITNRGDTVQFKIVLSQLWKDWCGLQTSYPMGDSESMYLCRPNVSTSGWDGDKCALYLTNPPTTLVRDCGYVSLCGFISPCSCTKDGCRDNPDGEAILFDLTLDETDGEAALFGALEGTARLTRE